MKPWAIFYAYGYNLQRDIRYVRKKGSFQMSFFVSLAKWKLTSYDGNTWELQSYWDCTN